MAYLGPASMETFAFLLPIITGPAPLTSPNVETFPRRERNPNTKRGLGRAWEPGPATGVARGGSLQAHPLLGSRERGPGETATGSSEGGRLSTL